MDPGITVLIVDDDRDIVELMRDFLEADGFKVQSAHCARVAQALLEQGPIDCVLLDVMMPDQSGFELCRQIRATRDLPILFLSARDTDIDKIRGLGLGADDYVIKSATPAEVIARIKAVLRRYRSGGAQPEARMDFGRLVIDVRAHAVHVDGQLVP